MGKRYVYKVTFRGSSKKSFFTTARSPKEALARMKSKGRVVSVRKVGKL